MNGFEHRVTVDQLLQHRGWLQRIARQLAHDEGADAAQEVWAQAVTHPPSSAENPRGWLRAVLLNRLRSRSRSMSSRRARERETVAWSAPPATPEEATARLELQRKLAAALTGLAEPYRHVIYLRFVEDRAPAEIAVITATPPGTVRWRLKEGLAKLRTELDREYGDRRAWTVVLAPVAKPRRAWARARPVAVALAAAPAIGLLLFTWHRGQLGARGAQVAQGDSAALRAARTLPALLPARESADACPLVAPMRASLEQLKTDAAEWRNLRELYAESAPNPKLEEAARPIIDAKFAQAGPGCEHSVSCRGRVCDVTFLTPDGADARTCWPQSDMKFTDYLSSGSNNNVDSGTPVHDPVNGRSYLQQSQLWRFYRDDAQPVPVAARPPLPALQLSAPPPLPAGLTAECARQWRLLARQHDRMTADIVDHQPDRAFATSPANAELAGRVSRWSAAVLERSEAQLPFTIACRGRVCALTPGAADDPLAIKWQCREPVAGQPRRCFPARDDTSWFNRLEQPVTRQNARIRPAIQDGTGAVSPAYLSVLPTDSRPGPWRAALAFAESFDWHGTLTSCAGRFPAAGTLKTMTSFPEVTGDEAAPLHPAFHAGGDLAGTPTGKCVIDGFQAAAAQFAVPPISNGLVLYADFKFPLDVSSFGKKLARLRERADEERTGPRL